MLLTTAILLMSLNCAQQDAAAPEPPEASSTPETASPGDADSEQAAREILDRARARLYDIRSSGLETLGFMVPIRMSLPTGETIDLGHVAVDWSVSDDPLVAVTVSETLPEELAQNSKEISFQLEAQGRQLLRFIDNDIFTALLSGFDPSLGDRIDDLVRVHFEPKPELGDAAPVDWYFDADDVPVRFDMTIAQGEMSMTISYEHSWAPASETDPSLVLQELTIVQEMGPMQNIISTRLDHETISGLVVLVGYTESGLTPTGDPVTNRVELEDLTLTVKGDG
jgi:hypothetical protein